MSASLKITADTSDVKKSILDLARSFKDIKGSKLEIFSKEDKAFLKTEFKKEISMMKGKLKENATELKKMVKDQQAMVKGTKDELELRKKIVEGYKVQAKLGKELGQAQGAVSGGKGGGGGGGEGMLSGIAEIAGSLAAAGALAIGAYGVMKTVEGTKQYTSGVGNRNKLKGLGVQEDSFGSAGDLASVGLTEQEMIQRRIEATKSLGRQGSDNATEMRKAGFERAYGLDSGTMTGAATAFRGQVGGKGATDIQMKLQASVIGAGIEDAIGPYLQSAVTLLTSINETGTSNTAGMTALMATLTKSGERSPELIAKNLGGIDAALKGSSGDANAYLQAAFARKGIGGGTIGGTQFALEAGGLGGLDRKELEKRGYNKDLLDNMDKAGQFSGPGERGSALLDMAYKQAGLGKGQKIGDIKDPNQLYGLNNLANNTLGTKGMNGIDSLKMLESAQDGKMSGKELDEKMKGLLENSDPSVKRLDLINQSLSGQTEVLTKINNNLLESLGKEGVVTRNQAVGLDNQGIQGMTNLTGAVNSTGVIQGTGNALQTGMQRINNGDIGEQVYDMINGTGKKKWEPHSFGDLMRGDPSLGLPADQQSGTNGDQLRRAQSQIVTIDHQALGKTIADEVKKAPVTVNVKTQLPDGKVTDRTTK
jgi:hypothetical protein